MSDDDKGTSKKTSQQQQQCLGTRCIAFKSGQGDGMMALFRDSDENSNGLRVVVTNGTVVCEGILSLDKVSMKLLDAHDHVKKKLDVLAGYLLHNSKNTTNDSNNDNNGKDDADHVIAEYFYRNDDDETHVRMQIMYRDKTGEEVSMKKAWKGRLELQQHTNAMLIFCNQLGFGVNQLQQNQRTLQTSIDNLKEGQKRWKRTAEKLEGKWQTEKDQLFQQFLVLYNKVRSELTKARDACETLRNQQRQQPASPQIVAAAARAPQEDEHSEHSYHGPDDNDDNVYPQDLVDRLAAGPVPDRAYSEQQRKRPAAKTNNSNAYKKKRSSAKSDDSDSDATTDDSLPRNSQKKRSATNLKVKTEPVNSPITHRRASLKKDDSDDSDW